MTMKQKAATILAVRKLARSYQMRVMKKLILL